MGADGVGDFAAELADLRHELVVVDGDAAAKVTLGGDDGEF